MMTLVWTKDGANEWQAEGAAGRRYRVSGAKPVVWAMVEDGRQSRVIALADSIERGKQLCERDAAKQD